MRISTVREFRDHATGLLRSKAPILVTRRGRLAGIFFPWPEETMPVELKREVFSVLSEQVRRHVSKAVASLPVTLLGREVYEKRIPEARRRIARRDPDDVEILALALHTGLPIWSNDNDFESAGIEWFATAELLATSG